MGASLIGIDFGTAVTRAARWSPDDRWTERVVTVPSVAAAQPDSLRVGEDALRLSREQPEAVLWGVKRLLERPAEDEAAQALVARSGATLYMAGARPHVRMSSGAKLPVDGAVAALLHQAAMQAAAGAGPSERYAVITTPAWYGSIEQGALRAAADRAGLQVLRLIGDGAALALWLARSDDTERTVAIVNAGAGGVSVTIASIDPQGVYIAATADDPQRGGDDVTAALVDGVRGELADAGPGTSELVRQAVESLRLRLIDEASVEATVEYGDAPPQRATIALDRTDLLPALNSLEEALGETCEEALADAELEADEVDEVVATGGMSAFPKVRQRIAETFEQEVRHDPGFDHQVALGATYEAAVVTQQTRGPLVLDGMSTGKLSLDALKP